MDDFEKLLGLILLGIVIAVALEFARVMPSAGYVVHTMISGM